MTIRELFSTVMKKKLLVIFITLVFLLGAYIYAYYFINNTYQSSAIMIISMPEGSDENPDLTYSQYNLNIKLVNSYRVLCKTDRILNQVLETTGINMSTKALAESISVTSANETEIINVSVEDEDPNRAALLANTVANVFESEVPKIMKMNNVQIIDSAVVPTEPVSPNRPMILAIALLIGLFMGIGIALAIEYFDVSIKSTEQLESILGVPVIGVVPLIIANDR